MLHNSCFGACPFPIPKFSSFFVARLFFECLVIRIQHRSTAELFVKELTNFEGMKVYAYFLTTSYDRFVRECKERNFTPEVKLFTLWLNCQRPETPERQIN